MTCASENLAALGITLPPVAVPLASYVPAIQIGNQVSCSGQLPLVDGKLTVVGKLGDTVTIEQGQEQAKVACLNALAAVASKTGGVDSIKRVLKVVVYVSSAPDFVEQAVVANGASDLLGAIFGECGKHIRAAVGVAVLPKDSPVEVELTVEV